MEEDKKWEGKVSTILPYTQPHQIFPFFKDFFNIHKILPSLATSYGIHGTNGVPGCIRYCLGSSIPPVMKMDGGDSIAGWAKERLVAVDEEGMSLSYEIVESNLGFNSYSSTVRISPCGDQDQDQGCVIEWVFKVDPVQGLRFEELLKKYEVALHRMANQIHLRISGNNRGHVIYDAAISYSVMLDS